MAQKLNTRTSIVDYLKSQNKDSSFSARAKLAQQHGIKNYKGTASQNVQLLNILRSGASSSKAKTTTKTTTTTKPKTTTSTTAKTTSSKPASSTTRYTDKINEANASIEKAMADYKEFLRSQSDSFYQNQEAMLDSAREQRLNELKKAYDEAVRAGEMSKQEAEEQFAENVELINEEAYLNSQITELSGESRGIGNSQQLLAMQQGDQRHTASLRDENRRARDKRLNEIRDRIDQITNAYNLDVSETNTLYNNSLRQARAQADQMFAQGMGEMTLAQYRDALQMKQNLTLAEQQQLDMLERMEKQHGYNLEEMKVQNQYTLEQMAVQQRYTQDNMRLDDQLQRGRMSYQHKLDLEKMKTQHGYDMQKIEKQFQNDLAKMAKQHGYDMSKLNQQQRNAMAQINAQRSAAMAQADAQRRAEEQALKNAYLNPNSWEYKVRMAQIEESHSNAYKQAYNEALAKAEANFLIDFKKSQPRIEAYKKK